MRLQTKLTQVISVYLKKIACLLPGFD